MITNQHSKYISYPRHKNIPLHSQPIKLSNRIRYPVKGDHNYYYQGYGKRHYYSVQSKLNRYNIQPINPEEKQLQNNKFTEIQLSKNRNNILKSRRQRQDRYCCKCSSINKLDSNNKRIQNKDFNTSQNFNSHKNDQYQLKKQIKSHDQQNKHQQIRLIKIDKCVQYQNPLRYDINKRVKTQNERYEQQNRQKLPQIIRGRNEECGWELFDDRFVGSCIRRQLRKFSPTYASSLNNHLIINLDILGLKKGR